MGWWQRPRSPASARRWGWMVLSWPAPSIGEGSALACAVLQQRVWLGLGRPSAEGLAWPGPSFSGGSGLAWAAIPPTPPSNVFQDRGTRCTSRRLRPLHPARRRSRACVGASAALPHLPPSMGQGQSLIVVSEFFSRISGGSGTEASRSHRASIASHRGSIADPSRIHRVSIASHRASIAHPSRIQEVCLATALAPAPGFPGGLRAWGTSPRGALPQGRLGGCHWRRR